MADPGAPVAELFARGKLEFKTCGTQKKQTHRKNDGKTMPLQNLTLVA